MGKKKKKEQKQKKQFGVNVLKEYHIHFLILITG